MSILAGYIVPHPPLALSEIGRGEQLKIGDTIAAFDEVARDIARIKPETIILASPHSIMYKDYFHISPGFHANGSFASFGAPQVSFSVDYDAELVSVIAEKARNSGTSAPTESACNSGTSAPFPAGTEGERNPALDHGTMVPLYFINKRYTNYQLIRIGLSGLSMAHHYELGCLISQAACDVGRRCVFVASGDLSHCQKQDGPYGYRPEGPAYDKMLMDTLSSGDLRKLVDFDESLLDASMECGHGSFTMMAGALEAEMNSKIMSAERETLEAEMNSKIMNAERGVLETRVLSHEATFGVGYGVCICHFTGQE